VTIPDSVTTIGEYAFFECEGLTSVTIGSGVTSIRQEAFTYCTSLASVTIPDSVTSIGEGAFGSCTSLTSVTIPDSVTSIGNNVFHNCTGLTSLKIGSGVISIPDWAFAGCANLASVTIPASVTQIGHYAFYDCTSLTSAYFLGNRPSSGMSVFDGTDDAIVYYLSGTTGWSATFEGRPTEEAPLGGIPVDGLEGWFFSEWFGFYATPLDPWLFHAEHGFLYRDPGSSNQSLFFFDDAMHAWWWTSGTNYPYIYSFDPPSDNSGTDVNSCWLFYFEGSKTPRSFGVVTGDSAGEFLFFGP
jgi:hypothetical protein